MLRTVYRLWTMLRKGYDPDFKHVDDRLKRIEDMERMNGYAKRGQHGH